MISRIKSILRQHGYILYSEPYRLNIVGMRNKNTISNRFDDEVHIFYRTTGNFWNYHVYKATTDPGTFWLENPENPGGTAILAQGQYVDAYSIGMHHGEYPALVQTGNLTIIRDYDRRAVFDFNNGHKITGSGFGINIHRASSTGSTLYVDKYSAGCQVFQNAVDFQDFMGLCAIHAKMYGNSFTYTLIDFRSVKRETRRRIAIGASVACTMMMGLVLKGDIFHFAKGEDKEIIHD